MFKLKRLSDTPILSPVKEHSWESRAVFNAGAIKENGIIHLFYRASNNEFKLKTDKPLEENKFVSCIGHASSTDGIHFKREDVPMIAGKGPQEDWGMEDPRITKIDDKYYIVYTGFGGKDWDNYRISMVSSKDMVNWEGHSVLLDEPDKDAALLPEKINGKFVLFHRRIPSIWISYSDDLKNFTGHKIVMKPIPGTWQSKKVGIAGTPIKRKDGWLLFYHAVDDSNVYRLGAVLLDLKDPSKVIARQKEPILEPETQWEKEGLVSNVVFSCGAVENKGMYYVYYGGGDTHIGVAAVPVKDVKF